MVLLFTITGIPLKRDHQESLANASQNTATKPEPAQHNSLCSIFGLLLNPPCMQGGSMSLWNSISRALSCSLHPELLHVVCIPTQGKHQGSAKRNFLSVKKQGHHLSGQQSESHELAKETISLLQGVLYLDDKLLWLNCFWLPSCVSLLPVYLHCCNGENYGKLQ